MSYTYYTSNDKNNTFISHSYKKSSFGPQPKKKTLLLLPPTKTPYKIEKNTTNSSFDKNNNFLIQHSIHADFQHTTHGHPNRFVAGARVRLKVSCSCLHIECMPRCITTLIECTHMLKHHIHVILDVCINRLH